MRDILEISCPWIVISIQPNTRNTIDSQGFDPAETELISSDAKTESETTKWALTF